MTTKTLTTPHVTLTREDEVVAEKLKARAQAKKEKLIVLPPLMALI